MKTQRLFSKFLSFILLALCSISARAVDIMDSKGWIALQEKKLILLAFGLMLLIIVPTMIMILVFAIRYRESNKNAPYDPKWNHSSKIEFLVWLAPILIICVLAYFTYKTTFELDPYKPLDHKEDHLEVQVIALPWKWLFVYPDNNVAAINELFIPVNKPISFKLTAIGPMQSFFVPQLAGQIYAMAGMQTKLHVIANEKGVYDGFSAAYSGRGFSDMKFKVHVVEKEDFDNWINQVKKSPAKIEDLNALAIIAKPSVAHPVSYYGYFNPVIFKELMNKYMAGKSDIDTSLDESEHEQYSHTAKPA